LNILKTIGYNKGLCVLLNSDSETGIVGDAADINRRKNIFGRHQIRHASIESFTDILSRQFEDDNVISLIWAASVYLIFAFFSPNNSSFIQSLTIFSGLFFACFIAGVCDYLKQKQFLMLEKEVNKQKVTVYRGQYGAVKSIKIKELVVGDIIEVNPGDRVPADCLLLEEMNMTVDQ
jgi:magnesium-transporting ATPase (P-type)